MEHNSEVVVKKSLIHVVAATALLAIPAFAIAQSNAPVTRAEVRSQLIQIEQAGYNPATSGDVHYPGDAQKAEARVAAQRGAYGGTPDTTSVSGAPVHSGVGHNSESLYEGH